jgi:hypothetical protein
MLIKAPANTEFGRYGVQAWHGHEPELSQVRNCVLDRILAYMRHVNVRFLWIDAHCNPQDTSGASACHHFTCN